MDNKQQEMRNAHRAQMDERRKAHKAQMKERFAKLREKLAEIKKNKEQENK